MKVKDLIKQLMQCDPDLEIRITDDNHNYAIPSVAYANEWHDSNGDADMVCVIEISDKKEA